MACACEQTYSHVSHGWDAGASDCGCSGGMGAIAGVDGGECDKPVNFGVWPSEVDAFKKRLMAVVGAMDNDVTLCAGMDLNEKASWNLFSIEFKAFALEPTGTFGAYNAWTQACSYAHTIDGWQAKLSEKCKLSTPTNVQGASTALFDALPWVAGAVIAVAAVVGFSRVTAFLPTKRSR